MKVKHVEVNLQQIRFSRPEYIHS